ncbi:MAG: hypothetical protein H6587_08445 [Flavobacteriales bacterium]|nr:hypothetical protein [Flavobacteriales bacterium]MCB9364583.1 hypothetical protein [Flavobacteriales bacterium]
MELDFATIHLMKNGVLYFLPFTHVVGLNTKQIEEIYQAVILLTKEKPTPLYVDLKTHIRLNGDEKSLVVSKLASCITACGIKENNVIIRYVVHAFNHLYKPAVPIKMFKTEDEALEWLITYK